MIHIENLDEGLPIFKALGSEIRIRLVKLLLENKEMNMNELASHLGITNGALTSHVKKLEESGIVSIMNEHAGHGNQKVCRVNVDKILIDILPQDEDPGSNSYSRTLPVGDSCAAAEFNTCGLCTARSRMGEV
ncbi:MAG: winged helix-turn-helix transcriptional regulator, partial [Clostridiales bacterium]|nr:winged helix-turn-helix transcriptional regulator [Clostridiales bacterium]